MKTLLIFFALVASCLGQHPRFSIDRYKPEMHQDALMCLWSFNQGDSLDLSPHSFALTENGSPTYADRGVVLPASSYLSFSEWGGTVGFWVTPYYIINDAFTISGWCTWTDNTKHTGLFQFYRSGSVDLGIFNYYTVATSAHAHPVTRARETSATVYDVMQHHAATWDGGDLKLYLNGVLVATTTSSSTPYFFPVAYAPTIQSDIGKVHSYSGYLNIYGHLKFYSLARTASQIMREYQEGIHR